MHPRLLAALLCAPTLLPAQLQTIAAPHRVFRFEIGGSFRPVDNLWRDGRKIEVGDLLSGTLDARRTPLVGDVEAALTTLLGRAATPGSLGSLSTIAQWQRNVGILGAAWGITPKLTLTATLPIVSVRTERKTTFSASGATLGLNPASTAFGTGAGQTQTTAFLASVDASLAQLNQRITEGAYSGGTLTLAQQTLADATTFRGALGNVFGGTGSPILPLAESSDAVDVLARITALSNTLATDLDVTAIAGAPAFPVEALTAPAFNAMLTSPAGFDIRGGNGQPVTSIGRVEIGANLEMLRTGTADSGGMTAWGRALLRLGTASEPSSFALLDLGTGGRAHEIEIGGTVDLRRARKGVRGEATITLPLSSSADRRLATHDEILVPASRKVFSSRRAGMGIALSAQPWLVVTPRLSLTGLVRLTKRGEDSYSFAAGSVSGISASALGEGTGGSAVTLGLGMSYLHDGRHHDGTVRLPFEAGLSLERTVTGSGYALAEMVSKVYFRFYKR